MYYRFADILPPVVLLCDTCSAFRKLTPTYPLLTPPTPITAGTNDKGLNAAEQDALTKVVESTAMSGLAHTLEASGLTCAVVRERLLAYLSSLVGGTV